MADWLTATCDSELGTGDAPEWVHLVPSGRIVGRDGRNLVNDAPGVLIQSFRQGGIDIPVDYEHQSERGNEGGKGPVPAAGWIKALEVRKDGVWGRVSWTARARELIRNREYRFLSSALLYENGSRRVVKLKSAALVQAPNLHLTALSSQEDNMEDGYLTPAMRPWAVELCASNESAFDQFIGSAVPQFAHLHRETHTRGKPPSSANAQAASALAAQVAGQLGIEAASLAD